MAFWSDLGRYTGPTATRVRLRGSLAFAQNRGGPHRGRKKLVAVRTVNLATAITSVDIYLFGEEPLAGRKDVQSVYWLPWSGVPGRGQITSTSWDNINKSGCNYFLTSEFTGCRFVVDDQEVSHVAYGAGLAVPGPATTADRDRAEGASRLERSGRRKMSITPGMGVAVYNLGGYAIAFGYRDPSSRWAFRIYRFDGLANRSWAGL